MPMGMYPTGKVNEARVSPALAYTMPCAVRPESVIVTHVGEAVALTS